MVYNDYMKKYLSLTFLFLILLIPDQAQAQLGLTEALCDGTVCSACHLTELANRLIQWLIGVVVMLFAVLAVWAGFGLVTSGGNPSALQDAKSRFTNAFIGLLIVLSAWILVDTLMRGIVNGANGEIAGYGPWSEIQCASQTEARTDPDILDIEFLEEEAALTDAGLQSADLLPVVGAPASNCGANESDLVSIPGEGGQRAIASVVDRYVSMRSAASARGINLSINSSYRSDARQVQLWDACEADSGCPRGNVARPCDRGGGGSRHSSGVALDIASSGGRAGRCEVRNLCRSAGASFIMFYERSGHVHCDWGSTSGEVNVSC